MCQDNYTVISEAVLFEEQNGFRIGRSYIANVFIIKQVIENKRDFNLENQMTFLDLEKSFDRANRNQLWQILNRRGIPYHLIEVIRKPTQKYQTNQHRKENP